MTETTKPVAPKEPRWITLARGELGVLEGAGAANNSRVVKYFADAGNAGIREDSVAWCAAFVGAMLKRADIKPNGSLAARSYESYGTALKVPVFGCIGVKKRAGSSWQGHVGFVVGANATTIYLLGGNQGDKVSIAGFPRSEFIAFRLPSGQTASSIPLPTSLKGAAVNPSDR